MPRGRPPYPGVLTPREQEVLPLLREGLTNREIAERLGISLNGARYHVSEILSKLGVSTREEAARWRPQSVPLGRRLRAWLTPGMLLKAGAGAVVVAAGAGLVLLALGVIAMGQRNEEDAGPPAVAQTGRIVSGPMGTLVYVDDGDIWAKQLPDGTPHRLTTDGRSFAPRWSPSGEWILFERIVPQANNEVYVMRADGTEVRRLDAPPITSAWSPTSWSPFEDRLAYVEAGALVVEDPDGSERVTLVEERPGFSITTPVWSPDGQWIAYSVTEGMVDPAASECCGRAYVGLWASRADGSEHRERLADRGPPRDGLIVAGWTPDSRWILFDRNLSFSASALAGAWKWRMMPLDPNDLTNGGLSVTTAYYVLNYSDYVAFSADGRYMAAVNGSGRESTQNKSLIVMDTSINYGSKEITPPGVAASSPSWSPDGSAIAYVQQPEGDWVNSMVQRRIWLIEPDGSNARRLTKTEVAEERPQWSLDGRFILFVRVDDVGLGVPFESDPGGRISLWRYELATGREEMLLDDIEFYRNTIETNIAYFGHYDWDRLIDWHQ